MPSSSGTQGLIINVSLILFLSIKDPTEEGKKKMKERKGGKKKESIKAS